MVEEYIVKKGDTLYSISKKYNISTDELKKINNLISNTLSIGQVLKLKYMDTDNPIYIVKKNDTLFSIAKNNNVSVEELVQVNNLINPNLKIGQELYIPKKEEVPILDDYEIYTVKKGDSLWKISKEYNITIPELEKINNLSDLKLQINQKLLVPRNKKDDATYIVQKGDSLWSIARKYNLTVDELKGKNSLDSNLLSIGQKLII